MNERKDVSLTVELGLCLSCEICLSLCPADAISMERKKGLFIPLVDRSICTNCGICIENCPGIKIENGPRNLETLSATDLLGNYIEIMNASAKDPATLMRSTSGGIVSLMITKLLELKKYNSAFVLNAQHPITSPVRQMEVTSRQEVQNSAGSKYLPVSVYNIIEKLKGNEENSFIIIGTPCQITGIKRVIQNLGFKDTGILFLGLLCDRTLNLNLLDFYEYKFGKKDEKIIEFKFRDKQHRGWPGDTTVTFSSGRKLIVDRKLRMALKDSFTLKRCLLCLDKFNSSSDISFGDSYSSGKSFTGRSVVIVRSERGKSALSDISEFIESSVESAENILRSQGAQERMIRRGFVNAFVRKHRKVFKPSQKTIVRHSKKLFRVFRAIEAGENSLFGRIARQAMAKIRQDPLKMYFKSLVNVFTAFFIFILGIIGLFIPRNKGAGKFILITGGGFSNKGAGAMTFFLLKKLKKQYPDKIPVVLSREKIDGAMQNKLGFKTLNWDNIPWKNLLNFFRGRPDVATSTISVFRQSSIMYDISGYSLSSQWPFERSVNYLLNIILCRIFRTRHIIMPQSIGPFKYKFLEKVFLFPLFKLHLPYSDIIYARESQGLREAGRFSFRNLRLSPDLVLLSGPYSREAYPSPKGKIVGIVPSRQLLKYTSRALLTDIYSRAVKYLLNMGNEVLLIVHSKEDMGIALEVFGSADSDKVRITAGDLSGQSLEKQIAACDYIIASRYHSIVHAYRSGTPVIALGWAVKYSELMKIFHQNIYYMDIANVLNREQICDMIDQMEKNHFNESEIIRKMHRRICLNGDKHSINFIKDASS